MSQPATKKLKVLFATNNPGKVTDALVFARANTIELITPKDVGLTLDVEESGSSYEENAFLKAQAFQKALNDPSVVVIADDGGIEIPALNNEPGIHTRRWKGYAMSDDELIEYCLERMAGKTGRQREATFISVLCVLIAGRQPHYFQATLEGYITDEPAKPIVKGFPFKSLMYIPVFNTVSSEVHGTTIQERNGVLTHREKALQQALEWIQSRKSEN